MKKQHPGGLKLSKNRTYYSHFASGVFVFFGTLFISGLASSSVFPVSDTSAQTISVENRNTGYFITVDAPASASIEVTPTASGSTAVSSASSVNVVTNAPGGYKLYLSATNVNLSASGVTPAFVPTSSTSLSDNSWGYSLDQSTWNAVTTSQTQIAQSSSSNYSNGTNTNVYYGVNANTNMPAATYSTTVTYTAVAEGIPEQYTMQGFTIAQCTAMSNGENITLMDIRDGKNYRVTKLADGNCWMTENLALDGGRTLTPNDSNVTENRTLPANIPYVSELSYDTIQITSIGFNDTDSISGGEIGNRYNWNAATAGTGIQSTEGITYESICPKNWRLPDASGEKSYANLLNMYGLTTVTSDHIVAKTYINTATSSPLYFTISGLYNESGMKFGETFGYYYTRATYQNATYQSGYAYSFSMNTTSGNETFSPAGFANMTAATSVRCVFQGETVQNNMFMQDITAEMCSNLAESTASVDNRRTVIDGRDGKSYKISHLADGNCWMVQNLALDGGRTLQPTDSNITTNVTLPANITSGTASVGTAMQIAPKYGSYDGNYYNFCTTIVTSNCSQVVANSNSDDICPKNWHVPTYNSAKGGWDYTMLLESYGLPSAVTTGDYRAQLAAAPLYFSMDGGYSSSYTSVGVSGWYAIKQTDSSLNAWGFDYDASRLRPAISGQGKGLGKSVRCVLGS